MLSTGCAEQLGHAGEPAPSAQRPHADPLADIAVRHGVVGGWLLVFDAGQRKQPSQRFRQARQVQFERAPAGADGVLQRPDERHQGAVPAPQVAGGKSHARAGADRIGHGSQLVNRTQAQFVDQPVAAQRQDRLLLLAGDLPRRTHGLHVLSTVLRRHEHTDPLPVSVGDHLRRRLGRDVPVAPGDQRIPEGGAAHGEADEARHRGGRAQPLATFWSSSPRPRMMQPTLSGRPRRAAATTFSQSSRCRALDLPDVRLDAGVLQLLDGLHHQLAGAPDRRPSCRPPAASSCAFSGGTSSSNMNRLAIVQIVGERLQPRRLARFSACVAFRVVAHQHLAEGRVEGLDVCGEVSPYSKSNSSCPLFSAGHAVV